MTTNLTTMAFLLLFLSFAVDSVPPPPSVASVAFAPPPPTLPIVPSPPMRAMAPVLLPPKPASALVPSPPTPASATVPSPPASAPVPLPPTPASALVPSPPASAPVPSPSASARFSSLPLSTPHILPSPPPTTPATAPVPLPPTPSASARVPSSPIPTPHIVPSPPATAPANSSDDYCDSVPSRVRLGCKMVAQTWAEGRKAEAEGRIVSSVEHIPPPYSGIRLPWHPHTTHEQLAAAQPPLPKVVPARYACMNMTCLCPYLGGVSSSAHDQCTLPGSSTLATDAGAVPPRERRQSGTPNLSLGRAVRMEYRMLSDGQRARFHSALQLLKSGFGSFEYDRLSALHSNVNMMPSAHGGPTFLLWHREYIKRMEIALRAIDPSVGIPFWDSTMDQRLPNPADSIMWSNLFMGSLSAAGTVADGPLANWVTPSGGPIRRFLGSRGGNLLTEQEVATLISQPQLGNFLAFSARPRNGGCTVPTPNPLTVLEFVHNGVHGWVGGNMGPLTTSPQDPVFFLHHSFVDYIWEQWRSLHQNRQQRETQYPSDAQIVPCSGSQNFMLNATMFPFLNPVVLNQAALSNTYTDSMYTYAPRPTCRAAGGCGSLYLFCDTTSGRPLCTSRIKPGGNCAPFAQNADQPCFTSTCVNGRCQAVAAGAAQP